MLFQELLYMWLNHNQVRLKGGTIHKYLTLIDTQIAPELGSLPLSAITPTAVNAFLCKKMQTGRLDGKGGLSPSYVRSITLVISSALKFAVEQELCAPFKSSILKPQLSHQELTLLSLENQRKLENEIRQNPSPTNIGILISLYTGLRIGEICALTWNDIDLESNILHVRHTVSRVKNTNIQAGKSKLQIDSPKTRSSSRQIPIPSTLQQILLDAKSNSVSLFVTSHNTSFVSPRTFEYRFHSTLKKCGIEPINFHVLRHTFATRCIEAGVDVKSLSEMLGHASVNTTLSIYVHSSMQLKREQLEKLCGII